jgi:hypothetical protein
MHLEIVTHCWRYSRVLAYQLSSLAIWPPKSTTVNIRVFHAAEDQPTVEMLDFFRSILCTPSTMLSPDVLPRRELLARTIGRNIAAKSNTADFVWFCDADYFFGPGCLDSIFPAVSAAVSTIDSPLFYPRVVWWNPDRESGDRMAARVTRPALLMSVNRLARPDHTPGGYCGMDEAPGGFVASYPRRAIGGLQIARGDAARRGYAPDSEIHLRPVSATCMTMNDFRGDIAFRRQLRTRGTPIDIVNVYRIRQTQTGRVDAADSVVGDAVAVG